MEERENKSEKKLVVSRKTFSEKRLQIKEKILHVWAIWWIHDYQSAG